MVAIIKTGNSIHSILNYNENKVKEDVALCIGQNNYPLDLDEMNFNMKLNHLLKQVALNDNVKRHSVHISLNFDPSETAILTKEKLMDIATTYMDKIGFGKQPYLVYQHHDSGHPHIHITSIKIREDGSRIDTQNIGRNQSETARKEIEQSFGLVKAESSRKNSKQELTPISVGKIQYGKAETKKAIANVLNTVLHSYKYSSLPELNAVLNLYNVHADRGSENSRIFQHKGLVYHILDAKGNPIGVPIKASNFYNKPTLSFLEEKFASNKSYPLFYKNSLKNTIDMALLGNKIALNEFINQLKKEGIHIVLRQNKEGVLYGITYVDHRTKSVFNGSSLGKQYSAKAILERCESNSITTPDNFKNKQNINEITHSNNPNQNHETKTKLSDIDNSNSVFTKFIELLTQSEQTFTYVPSQLKGKRKKQKRKGQSGNL